MYLYAAFTVMEIIYGQLHDHQKSDFFGKINKFQFKWIKPLKYDVKTLETTFLKF